MEHGAKQPPESGISISLPLPTADPDLFAHKATDDVLLFLSRHRLDQFSLAELATQTGHPKPTVRRAIDVLETNDLVTTEREGNRRLVQISRDRLQVPSDPFLRIPQEAFQDPVKAAVDELRDTVDDLVAVILYGSVARGEADRRSDIDLWVLVNDRRADAQRQVNELRQELEERTFDGDRYAYDIDVESVSSIPRYSEDVREIVLSGIPVLETETFETVEQLLRNEVDDDE
jgi:predicted nucleotidyltransferase